MRLAAIDVGTNSIHTVIVSVGDDFSVTILDSTKETVLLGRGLDNKENLSVRVMTDTLDALRRAKILCESHHVDIILAVATSAIREAPNGLEFLRLVQRETGIEVRVISGEEEARLIYLAVRESIRLDDKTMLCVDIGGGSVEFIWGTRERFLAADSLKLGGLRLADHFPLSDPPTRPEVAALEEYIHNHLDRLVPYAAAHPHDCVVGTSGTILQLCRLALEGMSGRSLHQQSVSADALRNVCDRLIRTTVKERLANKNLDRMRVHTIVPGAILMRVLLERFRFESLIACEYALREGVLYDYIEEHRTDLRDNLELPDIRRRSVLALARKCRWHEPHSRHVAELCLMIFDQLAPHFQWGTEERDWLEYAALLHDIGMLISVPAHHRHSQYLIQHGELLGFTPREIGLMGQIARFHRRAKPKKRHPEFAALSKTDRDIVQRLAGILRLAEGFDRTQFGLIRNIHCELNDGELRMTAVPIGDAEVEHASAVERADMLEEALGVRIEIRLAPIALRDDDLLLAAFAEQVSGVTDS